MFLSYQRLSYQRLQFLVAWSLFNLLFLFPLLEIAFQYDVSLSYNFWIWRHFLQNSCLENTVRFYFLYFCHKRFKLLYLWGFLVVTYNNKLKHMTWLHISHWWGVFESKAGCKMLIFFHPALDSNTWKFVTFIYFNLVLCHFCCCNFGAQLQMTNFCCKKWIKLSKLIKWILELDFIDFMVCS